LPGASQGRKSHGKSPAFVGDAWANAHRIPVEVDKPENERDYYLHPELYGAPEEKGIGWARHPEMMKRMKEHRAKSALVQKQ